MGRGSLRFNTQEELEEHLRGVRRTFASAAAPSKPAKRASKFGSSKTVVDGAVIDSKLEARYLVQLKLEHKSAQRRHEKRCSQDGDLMWYGRQLKFDLEGGVVYIVDFVEGRLVIENWTSRQVFVDTKGYLKQESKNKIKQVEERYGIKIVLKRDEDVMEVAL